MWDGLLDKMTETIRDTFGQTVTYTRFDTGEIFEIQAIFDVTYSQSEAGGSVPTMIPIKELDVRIKDLGNVPPRPEDRCLIDRTQYRVTDIKPTTSGMWKAVLREVN